MAAKELNVNTVVDLFNGMDFEGAKPSTGGYERVPLPPPGEYESIVTGIRMSPTKFKETTISGERLHDAVLVALSYTTIDAVPGSASSEPLSFESSPVIIPKLISAITDSKRKTIAEMDRDRLAGWMAGILNRKIDTKNVTADMAEMVARVQNTSNPPAVTVKVTERPNTKNPSDPYRKDFITGSLAN